MISATASDQSRWRLLASAGVVQPGVVDGDAGRGGERHKDGLVLLTKWLGTLLFRHVEVPENLTPDAYRGSPKKVCIWGWFAGNPYESGWVAMSCNRRG